MTLAQWLEARNVATIATKTEAKGIFAHYADNELWKLDDYYVRNNTIGIYWLVPKEKKS